MKRKLVLNAFQRNDKNLYLINKIQINCKPYAPKNNNCLNKMMKSRRNENKYYKEIDLKAFESVLNKCKFINNIDVKEREFQNKR